MWFLFQKFEFIVNDTLGFNLQKYIDPDHKSNTTETIGIILRSVFVYHERMCVRTCKFNLDKLSSGWIIYQMPNRWLNFDLLSRDVIFLYILRLLLWQLGYLLLILSIYSSLLLISHNSFKAFSDKLFSIFFILEATCTRCKLGFHWTCTNKCVLWAVKLFSY